MAQSLIPAPPAEPTVRCRGMCGATQVDDAAATLAGWSYLHITAGWRCGACERALIAAGGMAGTLLGQVPATTLADDSRGALRKETASTILPVAVKGYMPEAP